MGIRGYFKLKKFQNKWRQLNKHNYSVALNIFPINNIIVGKGTYGGIFAKFYGGFEENIKIGNYCSIASEVLFCTGGEHDYKKISTYPFENKIYNKSECITKGPIIVMDDVWIGCRALILSGVTIGQGAIIAAGSVISKDVPPYAIATTNGIIKYRFPEKLIEKLVNIDYSAIDFETYKSLQKFFSSHVNLEILNENSKNLPWKKCD